MTKIHTPEYGYGYGFCSRILKITRSQSRICTNILTVFTRTLYVLHKKKSIRILSQEIKNNPYFSRTCTYEKKNPVPVSVPHTRTLVHIDEEIFILTNGIQNSDSGCGFVGCLPILVPKKWIFSNVAQIADF